MITDLLSVDDLSRLRGLRFLARNRVEGFCAGLHRSPHKGHSVEFREHRPYSKGDELRGIDWKVYGKSDRLFIRQYEEETNLRCHLLVDTSGSMAYAGTRAGGASKLRYASRLATAMAYLMIHQQDSVGLVTFSDSLGHYLPPKSIVTHLGVIASTLLGHEPKRPATASDEPQTLPLAQLIPKLRRGGLVVLLSDCFVNVDALRQTLTQFSQARNDVLVLQVLDQDEVDFPFQQMAQFRSLERTSLTKRLDPARLRNGYLRRFEQSQAELASALAGCRAPLITVTTDQPVGDVIARLLMLSGRAR